MQGFGGGLAAAHRISNFQIVIDGVEFNVEALVTLCDISDADLFLGQPAIGESGVTLVVQEGVAKLCRHDGASKELRGTTEAELRNISLEEVNTRRRAVLSQDVAVATGMTKRVGVTIEGAQPGEEVYMEYKVFREVKEEVLQRYQVKSCIKATMSRCQ